MEFNIGDWVQLKPDQIQAEQRYFKTDLRGTFQIDRKNPVWDADAVWLRDVERREPTSAGPWFYVHQLDLVGGPEIIE